MAIMNASLVSYLLKALAEEIAEAIAGTTDLEVVENIIDELQVEDELRCLVCKKLNIPME